MMKRNWITTADAAKKIGIHPNTLRWYEKAGYLLPVPRTGGGYRTYTPKIVQLAVIVHQMQPALRIYGNVRFMGKKLLSCCRDMQLEEALQIRDKLEAFLIREHELALKALEVLDVWRCADAGEPGSGSAAVPAGMVYIGEAAAQTGLTRDRIINWERNYLLESPRDINNHYRIFGKEEIERMLVIRSCRTAGYSITAIRRLLIAIDKGAVSDRKNLEHLANSPHPAETALFPVFPTDTLPDTLSKLITVLRSVEEKIRMLEKAE